MARNGRKHITLLVAAIAVTVLVAIGVSIVPWVHESWLLCRLEAPEDSVRWEAAEALSALGSERAVQALMDLVDRDERERVSGGQATPFLHALHRMESVARPMVEDAVRSTIDLENKRLLSRMLVLLRAWEDGEQLSLALTLRSPGSKSAVERRSPRSAPIRTRSSFQERLKQRLKR